MKECDHYIKIVEWSDEDGCFVGSCPGITDVTQLHLKRCIISGWKK